MIIKSYPVKKPLRGSLIIPGDKSISHRSIIISSISNGKSIVSNILESEDVSNTLNAIKNLGVKIQKKNNKLIIHGRGLKSLKIPKKELYLGNSGTTARLITGLLANQSFNSKLTGDTSLSKRPMDRIINPLKKMGASFKSKNKMLPLVIKGKINLKPLNYKLPFPSSQIKSGLLLACLNTKGYSKIIETSITRDHTELMLKEFKANIFITKKNNYKKILIKGKKELKACNISVPGDFSSASFFIVAALLIKGSNVTLKNINLNPTRTGLLKALSLMKGNIKLKNIKIINKEKVGDIVVKYSKLNGCYLNKKIASTMIDEYPILSIAAAHAIGPSKFTGLKELRLKESDRLKSISDNLKKFNIKCSIKNNNITINPSVDKKNKIVKINSKKDHRVAMSFSIMGMLSKKGVIIKNSEYINTSFPNFISKINSIGAQIQK